MTVGERLSDIFSRVSPDNPDPLEELAELYHEDMRFQDPIQSCEGLGEFLEINRKSLRRARGYTFELHDRLESDDTLYLTWHLRFTPQMGPPIDIPGTTHAKLRDGRIESHRDYWDLAGAVLANVPLAGPVYRAAVARLG